MAASEAKWPLLAGGRKPSTPAPGRRAAKPRPRAGDLPSAFAAARSLLRGGLSSLTNSTGASVRATKRAIGEQRDSVLQDTIDNIVER